MNTKRILTWGAFIIVVGLITWGMIAAANKAERESTGIASVEQITEDDWVKGATSSPLVLIEYSDFQCPACGLFFPVIEKLIKENSDKVRLVYRHFPLLQHTNATPAARAAEAAGMQGKFWEMYESLFNNQENWEGSTDVSLIFNTYAQNLGLDMVKYKADYESQTIKDKINDHVKSGVKAKVDSTPTFYLNGKKIKNPQTYEEFKKLIEDAASATTNS